MVPNLAFHIFIILWSIAKTQSESSSSSLSRTNEAYTACVKKSLVVSEVFCLPEDYRKDVPPPMSGPVDVYLKLPVSEISNIDDQRSQISLRLTYKLLWPEPRMILNESADWSQGEINVRGDMVDHFWTPDIIIHDLVSFYKPEVLNQVAALEIKHKKRLYYKVRSDLTTVCKGMKFHRFPLDEHVCYLKLTSFGYNDQEMTLDGQFSYDNSNQRALPFNVLIKEISGPLRTYRGSNSNYSVYGLEIHLSRCVSPYLLNVYLPTAIFVVMSWVSFLIPTEVVPARIVLLVTLCLVIINTFNNVTARIPVASQVTALEIWLLACILLVFGALAEYAFILRQVIRLSRQQRKEEELSSIQDGSPTSTSGKRAGNAMGAPATPINLCSRPSSQISGKMGIAFQLNGRMGESVPDDLCNHEPHGPNQLRGGVLNDHEQRLLPTQHQHHHHHHHFHGHSHRPYHCSGERVPLQAFGARTNGLEGGHNSHSEPNVAPTEDSCCSPMDDLEPRHSCIATAAVGAGQSAVMVARKPPTPPKKSQEQLMKRYQEHVDGNALVIFPLSFLIFNIAYWGHFLADFWPT
ncbi:glycine receptor subunit alpha-4-like isoform X2 [Tigriopus californicus]|uniref:glycine receptor subunit alpha-4-like isoform X2 n=1 Tax=Tigriopus californicus TaxID=6832 RepID=UPI0027DA675F|nr:glycine receptor subunit alpha-4-like isoform X2 [Tigriopus californicus]